MKICDLDLSTRTFNALERAGITLVSQVVRLTPEQIATIPGLGKVSRGELAEELGKLSAAEGATPPVVGVVLRLLLWHYAGLNRELQQQVSAESQAAARIATIKAEQAEILRDIPAVGGPATEEAVLAMQDNLALREQLESMLTRWQR